MSLTATPSANRLHIGIFGKRNSGKSSLINAITGQPIAIVSDVAGTTADPVSKAMEINGLGPCMFVDTAGFDDIGELGKLRVQKTVKTLEKIDIAVLVFSSEDIEEEISWYENLKNIPVLAVINKADILADASVLKTQIKEKLGLQAVVVSSKNHEGIQEVIDSLIRLVPEDFEQKSITGDLCSEGDTVLLVMPQDIQAPKGRLILPQVQTIRELLDKKCTVISTTTDKMQETVNKLKECPKLIITDSQVFKFVYENKPKESMLTSFSVLFAGYKGDIKTFVDGAQYVDVLNENSKILIAEACSHVPLNEDIGRVQIPRMLKKRFGEQIHIDIVNGLDFPEDLSEYDLIIHCGSCMFGRTYVMNRIRHAKQQSVPITNYGIFIAKMSGILDKVSY